MSSLHVMGLTFAGFAVKLSARQVGYVDISHREIAKYLKDVEEKRRICKVLPAARFSIQIRGDDERAGVIYDGLVCHPMDMGGEATGVGASGCKNCKRKKQAK